MTLLDVLNIHETIRQIIETETETDYRLKFRLLGILHELDNPVKNFQRIRNEKIREYGKEDEEGNISIDPKDTDTLEQFNQDMQKLLLEEIHVTISRLQASDVFDSGLDTRYLVELYPVMEAE